MNLKESTYVIILASIASFFVAYISAAPAVALPAMAKQFALSNILQNWVVNVFLFSVAIFAVPLGSLSSKIGIKKSFIIGNIIFLIGSIVTGLAWSDWSLLIFRAFQGIGAALIYTTVMSIVTLEVPEEIRGKALGIVVAFVYIGLAVAPVIGGILTYNLGWPSIFYISIPFVLITLIITQWKLDGEWVLSEGEEFDTKGSILWAIAILLFIYGFTIINEFNGLIIAVIGIILVITFGLWEIKAKFPVYDIKVFKDKRFLSSNVASVISYIATFVVTYILNYHMQYILGMDSQTAGLFLIITPVAMAIVSPLAGKLSDKINPQKLAAIGMVFVTFALIILSFLNKDTPMYLIIFAMLVQGIGYGIFCSPNTNIIMSSVPEKDTPTASISVTVMRVIGQTMSLAMLTVIFAIIMGNVPIIPQFYGLLTFSCQITCIISGILCVIAIFASLVGVKSSKKI